MGATVSPLRMCVPILAERSRICKLTAFYFFRVTSVWVFCCVVSAGKRLLCCRRSRAAVCSRVGR